MKTQIRKSLHCVGMEEGCGLYGFHLTLWGYRGDEQRSRVALGLSPSGRLCFPRVPSPGAMPSLRICYRFSGRGTVPEFLWQLILRKHISGLEKSQLPEG